MRADVEECCPRKHPWTEENTYLVVRPGRKSFRQCRRCKREARHRQTVSRYGITLEEYAAMFAAQDGRCAVCRTPGGVRRLSVDHHHQTGQVRELLCGKCNVGIGQFNEDPELLTLAIRYLERHGQ
jgi:hypothetical protein